MKTNVYLLDETLFASGFNRVVHGGRGDYVEFEGRHILLTYKLMKLFKRKKYVEYQRINKTGNEV